MVVAVVSIRVMQISIHQVVDMISVRNSLMTAIGAMLVICIVSIAVVTTGAVGGIRGVDLELVLINVTVVERVKVSIVQVIGVVVVNNRGVAAILAVLMRMVLVDLVLIRHRCLSCEERQEARVIGCRGCGWLLGRVCQTVEDQIQHMLISQKVENVFPVAATSDDVVRAENPKPLRDDGDRLTLKLRQLGNAGLTLG